MTDKQIQMSLNEQESDVTRHKVLRGGLLGLKEVVIVAKTRTPLNIRIKFVKYVFIQS